MGSKKEMKIIKYLFLSIGIEIICYCIGAMIIMELFHKIPLYIFTFYFVPQILIEGTDTIFNRIYTRSTYDLRVICISAGLFFFNSFKWWFLIIMYKRVHKLAAVIIIILLSIIVLIPLWSIK